MLLVLAAIVPVAHAATSMAKRYYEVSAGDAATTLQKFVEQSGEQISIFVPKVRGVRTHPVKGEFTSREVLNHMLLNTGLVIVQDEKSGALMIQRAAGGDRPPRSPVQPESRSTSPLTSESTMQPKNLMSRVAAAFASIMVPLAGAADSGVAITASADAVQLSPFEVHTDGTSATSRRARSPAAASTPNSATPPPRFPSSPDFLDDIGRST